MQNQISCSRCLGLNVFIKKRGYSLKNGFVSFVITLILLFFSWTLLLYYQDTDNNIDAEIEAKYHVHETANEISGTPLPKPLDYANNSSLWLGTVFILGISFLYGLNGANKSSLVCLNCNHIKPIS